MLNFFKEVFKKGELRRKVVFTLGILFVFRLGAGIVIPYIDTSAITSAATSSGIFGIMNMLGGGTLEKFSLFSLGVSPYITSSIIIELLSMDVVPALTQWNKEGNTGKKKKDKVTRVLTLALAIIQGGSLTYAFDKGYSILASSSIWTYVYVVIVMAAGSMFTMWLGDQITIKGVGNGTSLLIFTGIVANLPNSFISSFKSMVTFGSTYKTATSLAWYILFVLVYLAIVVFVVFEEGAIRKIPIIYATNTQTVMHTKESTNLPIKINSSSVIPVIFAASVLAAPRTIISFMKSTSTTQMIDNILNYQKPIGFVLYIVMIILFTFFYSNLQIDAKKISEDLKKSGGAIPGVRTGDDTKKYIGTVLNRVTVVGSLFLAIIASIPIIAPEIWKMTSNNALSLGGTGLIIVTGVALETVRAIKSMLTRREYHGYIRK
ncbi:MAG: preprotein translocase subunit SecY [Catenibacterium mitsuokai]|jgi:preprotein translocase subunit SecY|uniref:preprotein translocase subunit SecY n=1 Tax=Catenibacterium TaxID=135858 RepID=UPI0006C38C25|nr:MULTISPECIES: preprotein translocase subunit SecY [Catenibacterium]CUP67623.1 preprotein translocase subunit SecY [Roseburia hominis]MCI6077282.1 preprotein translocase subunit SecY [Catenibacterium mitsuokai]MDD6595533.1 preprotein translocase subunit SecY [Catenibacterium mitsuokai]MDY3675401.1 preprotein translocase subunit SecY [Catenibacterium mitsuokai]MEE0081441.1 preprotein translocase subunit SecY [Catenibacterium mitsuokai]